jgi:Trafficking protein particle complex subunit 10, TRAPPC10
MTVHAKVTTQYQYFPPDVSDGNVKEQVSACSENVLETVLTTLEHSALSVSDVHLTTYAFGRSLLGVSLNCHTPTPFVLKSWKLTLPSYLVLDESPFAVDMNASLVDTMIVDHDQVNFGFHCKHCAADHSKSTHASLVVDVQDEYGSLFSEKLEIRLARISMPKTELPNVQSVSIKIQPSSKEAIVGSSIELDYVVDTTVFAGWKGRVSYSVDTDSDDWFVSGNIQGVVDTSSSSSFTLSLVAIPTRPGVSKCFPTLSLSLDEEGLEKPVPLTVVAIGEDGTHCRFHALAPPVSSSVGFLEQ